MHAMQLNSLLMTRSLVTLYTYMNQLNVAKKKVDSDKVYVFAQQCRQEVLYPWNYIM